MAGDSTPQAHGSGDTFRRAAEPGSSARRSRFAARMRLDWWWIGILVLCGSFQIFRGAPVDGVFFLAAAAALTADAAGWLAALDRYPVPRLHLAAQLALGAIAVAFIALVPQFDVVDLVIVSVVGATALIVGWRNDGIENLTDATPSGRAADSTTSAARGRGALSRPVRRSAMLWAAAGLFLCLWELASFFLAMPSATAEFEHPPLSDLIDPIVANPFGRAACAALWLLAGAALLKRGRRQ